MADERRSAEGVVARSVNPVGAGSIAKPYLRFAAALLCIASRINCIRDGLFSVEIGAIEHIRRCGQSNAHPGCAGTPRISLPSLMFSRWNLTTDLLSLKTGDAVPVERFFPL